MNRISQISALGLLALLFSAQVSAIGILDRDFGSHGQMLFRFSDPGTDDFAVSAALQPDGKIVIVGVSNLSGQSEGFKDFAIARLNTDGTLDKTFGNGGKVKTNFPWVVSTAADTAYSLIIQPDGKLMVGGMSENRMAMARYNSDGSLDTSFDGDGKMVYDIPESGLEAAGLVQMYPDGKYLVATGTTNVSPNPPNTIIFFRFNNDGQLDTTFGTNGRFTIHFGRLTYFGGATVLPDGKIMVGATYLYTDPSCVPDPHFSCERGRPILMRYHPDFRLDRKFGRNGTLGGILSSSPKLLSDGNFIYGGSQIKRYHPNGYFERAFDQYTFAGDNTPFSAGSLKEKADGKIVGCGALGGGNGYSDFGVILYNSAGQVTGTDRRDFFNANDYCSTLLVQPDGKVVLVGTVQVSNQGPRGFLVMRYTDFNMESRYTKNAK